MKFMMLMIPGVYQKGKEVKDDFAPDVEDVAKMSKYNDELIKAGAMITGEGLHPSSKGARVNYPGGNAVVTDGPFTESNEVLGGYWMIKAASLQEAIDWAKKIPAREDDMVEVRQVFEMEDFPEEVRKAAETH